MKVLMTTIIVRFVSERGSTGVSGVKMDEKESCLNLRLPHRSKNSKFDTTFNLQVLLSV